MDKRNEEIESLIQENGGHAAFFLEPRSVSAVIWLKSNIAYARNQFFIYLLFALLIWLGREKMYARKTSKWKMCAFLKLTIVSV